MIRRRSSTTTDASLRRGASYRPGARRDLPGGEGNRRRLNVICCRAVQANTASHQTASGAIRRSSRGKHAARARSHLIGSSRTAHDRAPLGIGPGSSTAPEADRRPWSNDDPTRKLPRSTIEVSELSLGCARLGNLYERSPMSRRERRSRSLVPRDRYFDTAPHYGLGLPSDASEPHSASVRARDVLSWKVRRLLVPWSMSRDSMTRASWLRPRIVASGTSAATASAARSATAWTVSASIRWTSLPPRP